MKDRRSTLFHLQLQIGFSLLIILLKQIVCIEWMLNYVSYSVVELRNKICNIMLFKHTGTWIYIALDQIKDEKISRSTICVPLNMCEPEMEGRSRGDILILPPCAKCVILFPCALILIVELA